MVESSWSPADIHPDSVHGPSKTLLDFIPGLAEAIQDRRVIDLVLEDVVHDDDDLGDVVVVPLSIGGPATHDMLGGLSSDQSYILIRDVLQRVKDYRSLLRVAFDRLAPEGWLVITVPHQFLRERKFRRPSRFREQVERFYTPASMLLEVQEALDPTAYRVRLLKDDDSGYAYKTPIDQLPLGQKRIVLALQKIEKPSWAAEMTRGDDPRNQASRPDRVLAVDPSAPVNQHVIQSSVTHVDRILVLKLDHRGDFLLSAMALRQLRSLYKSAHITLVCASWNAATARGSELVDEVLVFDFVAEDASADAASLSPEVATITFAQVLSDRDFFLAIDLSSHEKFRHLLGRVKAKHRAGFDRWNKFPFLDIRLCLPVPSEEGVALQGVMSAADFNTRRGLHRSFAIDFTRKRAPSELGEIIIWGPYKALGAGDYEFEILVEAFDDTQDLGIEICHGNGAIRLYGGIITLRKGGYPRVMLSLPEHVTDFEVRISVVDNGPLHFRFLGVGYKRDGVVVGVHQMEAMHLLVQLVNSRLSLPFVEDVFPS